jgi:beta-lactam-binding protein with PASTA domain
VPAGENVAMPAKPNEMPKVWDMSFEEAGSTLRAAGLEYSITRMQSLEVPKGALLTVSPRPGTPLRDGIRIVLTISIGPPVVPGQKADTSVDPSRRIGGT